jgi:hypothetical protein
MTISEFPDLDKIKLLRNSKKLRSLKNDEGNLVYDSYVRYFDIAELLKGTVPIVYNTSPDGLGRYTSRIEEKYLIDKSMFVPTLTHMRREVRGLLANENYVDVDFVNCHPTILEQVLARNMIPSPLLTEYNARRSEKMAELSAHTKVSSFVAKKLFISLIYGGSCKTWADDFGINPSKIPRFIYNLEAEISQCTDSLLMCPDLQPVKSSRLPRSSMTPLTRKEKASIISIFLQTLERTCLESLIDVITKIDGFKVFFETLLFCCSSLANKPFIAGGISDIRWSPCDKG